MIEQFLSVIIRCDTPGCKALRKYQKLKPGSAKAHAEKLGWFVGKSMTACPECASRAVGKQMAREKQ